MLALAIVTVLAIPLLAVLGLLRLVTVLDARRTAVINRQIALTDAIHGVVGPVVAPTVRRGRRGRWVGVLPVPAGHPQLGLMVEIAQAELGPTAEIVVVAQAPAPTRRRPTPSPTLRLSGARAAR